MAAPRVTPAGDNILITTGPYNADWHACALRGRWDKYGKYWASPAEKEPAVRQALRDVFSTDGSDVVYLVCELYGWDKCQEVNFGHRTIVRRPSQGSKIYTGEGMEIISSGYVRNWPEADLGPNDLMVGWYEEHSVAEEAARRSGVHNVGVTPVQFIFFAHCSVKYLG